MSYLAIENWDKALEEVEVNSVTDLSVCRGQEEMDNQLNAIQHAVPIEEIRNNQSAENGLPRGTMATCSAVLEQWKPQLCTLFAFHFPSPFKVLFFFSEAYAAHIFRNIFFPLDDVFGISLPQDVPQLE